MRPHSQLLRPGPLLLLLLLLQGALAQVSDQDPPPDGALEDSLGVLVDPAAPGPGSLEDPRTNQASGKARTKVGCI